MSQKAGRSNLASAPGYNVSCLVLGPKLSQQTSAQVHGSKSCTVYLCLYCVASIGHQKTMCQSPARWIDYIRDLYLYQSLRHHGLPNQLRFGQKSVLYSTLP